jgi:hypothetical protein
MSVELLLGKRGSVTADPISALASKVAGITASRSLSDKGMTAMALSTESFGDTETQTLTTTYNQFESTIKAMAKDMGISMEAFQVSAGVIGGMMAADPQAALSARTRPVAADAVILNPGVVGGSMERLAVEAYDERDNRNAQMHSVVFNLLSSRQDEFGETLFPTIITSPNEVGVTLALKLFYVYNDFKRAANGALANYNRKNVMRAYADMSILKNELTRVVPVLRTAGDDKNDDKFVSTAVAPAWSEDLGVGVSVNTGWLKTDTKVDLLGISQTNELLASGIMGVTDSLDTYIKLKKVLVRVTDGLETDVIALDVSSIPSATFTYAPQGNYRKMLLAMDTDSVVIGEDTRNIAGGALALLDELATHNARVQLNINGNATLDKADAIVNRGTLQLTTLRNAADQLVTGSVFDTLAAKLATAEVIGFQLEAFRANSNLRQRGQLVDTQVEYRIIPVPFRSPIGVMAPAARASADDTQALQTLVTLTGTRVSNEAVLTLRKWEQSMEGYSAVADASGTLPEMNAIGGTYLLPAFMRESASLPATVDSLKSHERFRDIRAALIEKIRFMANELYRRSEYQAVASVLTGNASFKPTVIVATDTVIHNYLSMDGDLRLLGDSFDVKVVSTLAGPVKDKIYVTFGVFDQSRNTTINPLNSGNMLYTPELVLNLPISRDGQHSNELTVTPRFAHIVNLPVLGVIDVSGLPAVTGKVTVNSRTL